MAWWLKCWIANPGVSWSKPLGASKVGAVFHPSEVDKMSTKNFWGLSAISKPPYQSDSSLEAVWSQP